MEILTRAKLNAIRQEQDVKLFEDHKRSFYTIIKNAYLDKREIILINDYDLTDTQLQVMTIHLRDLFPDFTFKEILSRPRGIQVSFI